MDQASLITDPNPPPLLTFTTLRSPMVPEPGLSPSEIRNLKLILSMSSSYYAKILPLYRESLEHRRFRRGKVKNFKGLQVKIYPTRCVAVTGVSPLVPASYAFPVSPAFTVQPQPSK